MVKECKCKKLFSDICPYVDDTDFSLEELRLLRMVMIDVIYSGETPETMRGYLNILDKIENIIKRKCYK